MHEEIILRGPLPNHPKLEKSFGDFIFRCLDKYKDRYLQLNPDTGIKQTYAEVKLRSIRVALKLKQLGLKTGDVVTLATSMQLDAVLPLLASFYLGVTVNILDEYQSDNELLEFLRITHPKLILCGNAMVNRFKNLARSVDSNIPIYLINDSFEENFVQALEGEDSFEPEEVDIENTILVIMCSSGSSGIPKGAPLTHRMYYDSLFHSGVKISTDFEIVWNDDRLVWDVGLWFTLRSIASGALKICMDYKYTQIEELDSMIKYKPTIVVCTTSTAYDFAENNDFKESAEIKNIKQLLVGGDFIPEEMIEKCRSTFGNSAHVVSIYGLTEMPFLLTFFDVDTEFELNVRKINSVGKLCPGTSAKIVDPQTGLTLPKNNQGELYMKGSTSIKSFYKNIEANKSLITEDGWLKSGDLAYFDEDECLYVIGRFKDLIKYDGFTVIPSRIEQIVNHHPDVVASCVVGRPNEMDENCAPVERLIGGVLFIDEFPKTVSGKIRKYELKKLLQIL